MIIRSSLIKILKFAGFTVLGGFVAIVLVAVIYLKSLGGLDIWHTAHFHEEFQAGGDIETFEQYLDQENLLFAEFEEEVLSQLDFSDEDEINRFQPGSISDPKTWSNNWNRTFLLEQDVPNASVLLLHGMSDSPYSLRSIGEKMHQSGATVLGLRIPGHGYAPSGLLDVNAEDMSAATELAVKYLHEKTPDKPIYLIGYSNGAALAIVYALDQIEKPELPKVSKIVVLSPAIGVTPAAAYAPLAINLGHILGVQRLAWSSIGPEYDPYKYTSFAVNAGYVTHNLTVDIREQIDALKAAGNLGSMPPVFGFSSVVDATVVVQDMISNLYDKLPENGSELFLFDTNNALTRLPLLADDVASFTDPIIADKTRSFALSMLTNSTPASPETILKKFAPGSPTPTVLPTSHTWPSSVYSLAHISLPFMIDDPLYGIVPTPEISELQLGALALRGERGVSKISATDMLRMRWNPFHEIMMQEIDRFLKMSE
ncbi:MAG: alpha/beta fold hydrolase [Roseibium sp.]